MKRLPKLLFSIGLIIFCVVLYQSCRKDDTISIPEGQQRVRIMLTDDPGINFQAVYVDIRQVEVRVVPDSCMGRYGNHDDHDHCGRNDHDRYNRCAVWDTLDIRPGVYNLFDLSNGTDTLLASGFTIEGKITKLRLTLGDNNSVVIDSVPYPLTLWHNNHHVLISVRGKDVSALSPNDLQLWLDFDVGRSIVKVRQNQFVLKPYLQIYIPDHTAAIKGFILPG